VTGEHAWLWWTGGAAAALIVLLLIWVFRKGSPFTSGNVFRASRLSRGNRLFPTQVLITPSSVVQYTPRWIGKREETIHMAHVASVKIDTGVLLANVYIETSGGASPIACDGHRKGDAVRMKELIEQYQTEYYRGDRASARPEDPSHPPSVAPPRLSR
jgi:hypothetical protein